MGGGALGDEEDVFDGDDEGESVLGGGALGDEEDVFDGNDEGERLRGAEGGFDAKAERTGDEGVAGTGWQAPCLLHLLEPPEQLPLVRHC